MKIRAILRMPKTRSSGCTPDITPLVPGAFIPAEDDSFKHYHVSMFVDHEYEDDYKEDGEVNEHRTEAEEMDS